MPIPELEEIMQLTIDFNLTNVELGKTFKALGALANETDIDRQQSPMGMHNYLSLNHFLYHFLN